MWGVAARCHGAGRSRSLMAPCPDLCHLLRSTDLLRLGKSLPLRGWAQLLELLLAAELHPPSRDVAPVPQAAATALGLPAGLLTDT